MPIRKLLAAFALVAASAHASVIIVGTRVIYPGGARDVSVRLQNKGDRPALVQAWLDRGDPHSTPESESVPFSLSPTLARIDADRGQVLRLVHTGESLPGDRESVFWLNVLEVPPKPDLADSNVLQFALRTRIKVFYRPKGLPDRPAEAARSLQWRLVRNGNAWTLEARNASPYFVSVASLSLRAPAPADAALATAGGAMVEPRGTQRFDLANVGPGFSETTSAVLRYAFIDDYGAVIDQEALLGAIPAAAPTPKP